jgi:hypothetical protein
VLAAPPRLAPSLGPSYSKIFTFHRSHTSVVFLFPLKISRINVLCYLIKEVMAQIPYAYRRLRSRRYVFTSEGKKNIPKVVDFIPLGVGNILNLGFGDLLPDGTIDDQVHSNNGDIIKVLATVVDILKDYTARYPKAVIYFRGSTDDRTRLYTRILRSYYQLFSEDFILMAIIGDKSSNETVLFDPHKHDKYLAFLVKRNS